MRKPKVTDEEKKFLESECSKCDICTKEVEQTDYYIYRSGRSSKKITCCQNCHTLYSMMKNIDGVFI